MRGIVIKRHIMKIKQVRAADTRHSAPDVKGWRRWRGGDRVLEQHKYKMYSTMRMLASLI